MEARPRPAPGVIAAYRGGEISIGDLGSLLPAAQQQADLTPGELPELYREAAATLAVRRWVRGQITDPIEMLKDRGEYRQIHRTETVELFLRQQDDRAMLTEEAAEAYYRDNLERFHQQPRRLARQIYRRHRDPGSAAATDAYLADLKRRALAGESFEQLAREHSDSETRLLGGRLGWIERGQLPKPLEDVLFSLREGEISDPITGKSGSLLLQATEVVEERQFAFEDVRRDIVELLEKRARRQRVAEEIAGFEPPAGSLILAPDELRRKLAGGGEEPVLKIGELGLSAAGLAQRISESFPGAASGAQVEELYEQLVQEELLYLALAASGWPLDAGQRAELDERIAAESQSRAIDAWIEERLRHDAAADGEQLRAFYRDGSFLYQSPLRLRLRSLIVPVGGGGGGGSRVMDRMERLRQRLIDGEIDFAAAGTELGVEVTDLGWLDYQRLLGLAPKIRTYLLELDGTGYAVPFQQGDRLHLTWVEAREEPRQLPFEDVAEKVLEDYVRRSQQRLYRELAAEILAEQEFRFDEAAVRAVLGLSDRGAGPAGRVNP